jgi:hypothetical protein
VVYSLTDDCQVVNDGVDKFLVVFERLEIHIGNEAWIFAIASRMS